jgi:hypothetical protein
MEMALTFPVLAGSEIVECMSELNMPVSLADLAKARVCTHAHAS